jgi:hypothetical protein
MLELCLKWQFSGDFAFAMHAAVFAGISFFHRRLAA